MKKSLSLLLLCLLITVSGCRGIRSDKPPIHPNPNLDWQAKYKDQTLPQHLPEGTVAWGDTDSFNYSSTRAVYLKQDTVTYEGKTKKGKLVSKAPIAVSESLLLRGKERFNIYCSVCHGESGKGNGMVVQRGYPPVPNLGEMRIVSAEDGHLYDVITNGIRNMPAYRKQISVEDRWAIVLYIRSLQKVLNQ